ncbi:MAG: ABC transporter permease [Candidatus Limnocylindrales bacterium]|jgi:peptide/nickel transport system permease protein
MGWYIGRRLLAALVTVWIVATAGFLLVEIIPGDPARQLAGPGASAETLAAIRDAYGFDDPLPVRYVDALARLAQGDLGYSFAKAEPVTDVLLRSLPPTLGLTGLAFALELIIAIPLALWVVSRGGVADRLLVIFAGLTAAIPAFLVGLLLIYLFAFQLRLFPLGGADSPAAYVLPVLTLGVPFGLVLARLLRTSLLEQEGQPYITFSQALGESAWAVRWRHLLPNALLPLLSILALDFAGLFSSVAVVEVAFSMPGLGADLLLGLRRLDTALIVGIGIVAGLLVALVNLLADVAVIVIDPRVRRDR